MPKSNNQSNSLFNIEFVQDISPETAANYSGGAGYLGSSDPDVILYKDDSLQGESLNLNAAIGDGLSNIGTNDGNGGGGDNGFNDQATSMNIIRGQWELYVHENFGGEKFALGSVGPGTYNLLGFTDSITSAKRVG